MTQTEVRPQQQSAAGADFFDGPKTPASFVAQVPIRDWGLLNCPAIPFWANGYGDPDLEHIGLMLADLGARGTVQPKLAFEGLATEYTIAGQTTSAYEFLYDQPIPTGPPLAGAPPPPPPPTSNELPLDQPQEFTLSWTTYNNVLGDSQPLVGAFAKTLTDGRTATNAFWPTIANFGLPYNLLVLAKVDAARGSKLQAEFGAAWATEKMAALQAAGLLYEIDMSILASVAPSKALDGTVRFTPGTVTVLRQDAQTKALTPIAISVSTTDGKAPRIYTGKDNAWLWALQAAKTSITVWGIWLGHVYHWHIVTAAMQMTMYNTLPAGHKLYPLLQPQSQSLIDFNFVLLTVLWGQIAPPTPVPGYMPFLKLIDKFADGRSFFDDDPKSELAQRGFDAADFTRNTAWDAYPVVGYLLEIWDTTEAYVTAVVNNLYLQDTDVAADGDLQAWMAASGDPNVGNVQGLPASVQTRAELAAVLTSILYRVTVHGAGSLNPSVNPVLSFVSNFPPCLQSADIPNPSVKLSPTELLGRLPHTGTIGGMTSFYYTFAYSQPDERLIPAAGVGAPPLFPPSQSNCDPALVAFRTGIQSFITEYTNDWNAALARILGTAPGPVPVYAQNQDGQWPLSIEI